MNKVEKKIVWDSNLIILGGIMIFASCVCASLYYDLNCSNMYQLSLEGICASHQTIVGVMGILCFSVGCGMISFSPKTIALDDKLGET